MSYLLSSVPNAEECDATGVEQRVAAGKNKKRSEALREFIGS